MKLRSFTPALFFALSLGTGIHAQAPAGYYSSVNTTSATTLRSTLHGVIDDHQYFPYTSGSTDTWNVLEVADEDPNNGSRILDVYRNASYAKSGGGNSNYNREHTWPKSLGFPNPGASNLPHNDCHQLYLCDVGYNSSRGHRIFDDAASNSTELTTLVNAGMGGGSGVYPGNSDWTDDTGLLGRFEIWGERRGDIARAMFYMDVRYAGGSHGGSGVSEPDLILTDDVSLIASTMTGSNESTAYMGALSTLLAWHAADPVDALEVQRNNGVFGFQGNRNPFVDHPEWVDCLFAANCDPGNPGRGGDGPVWINELHYDDVGTDSDERVEIAGPAGQSLSGYSVVAYNGSNQLSYQVLNLSGTIADQGGCVGALSFAFPGLQNGSADALALVDTMGALVEFISYEGTIVGGNGAANGVASVDIGVSETNATLEGTALGLIGSGAERADFTWAGSQAETLSGPNGGQTFAGGCAPPPAQPTGLVASSLTGAVLLNWDANTEPDLDSYMIRRSTTSGGPYTTIAGAHLTNSYADTGLTNGTAYFYVVRAVSTTGLESPDSIEDEATPGDSVAPSTPTSVVAVGGNAVVTLDWDANTEGDLAGYLVNRATSIFGPYAALGSSQVNSFSDTSVSNGVTYYYVVLAEDTSGNTSNFSMPVDATPTNFVTPIESFRNGTPANPAVFTGGLSGGPLIGTTWDPNVTPFMAGAVAHLLMIQPDGLQLNVPTALGTLLGNIPESQFIFFSAVGTRFQVPIPLDSSLPGSSLVTQGAAFAPGPVIELTNALDVVVGG